MEWRADFDTNYDVCGYGMRVGTQGEPLFAVMPGRSKLFQHISGSFRPQ